MQCIRCQRHPRNIPEYVDQANIEEMSPESYVRMDEGTYHSATDLFCCTDCYIKMGMPLNTQLIGMYEQVEGETSNVVPFQAKK